MTRAVGFDTSSRWGAIALVESADPGPPQLVSEVGLHVTDSHAAHLLGMLESILDIAGWTRSSVDVFAAIRGPGSFTGIRVGLGTLRGLGLASGRPCVGIGSLEAMAEAHGASEQERVPLIDAGRGEVYGARFDARSSPPRVIVPPWLGAPERALEEGKDAAIFGSGAGIHAERLSASGWKRETSRFACSIVAAACRLALLHRETGATDREELSPLYLRPADAETDTRP